MSIALFLIALFVQTLLVLAAVLAGAWVYHRAGGHQSPAPPAFEAVADAIRKARRPEPPPPKPGPDVRG